MTDAAPPSADATTTAEAPTGRLGALRARAAEVGQHLHAARERVVPLDVAWTTFERDRTKNGNLLAGAVAFRLFVYLLPLYLLVLVAMGVAVSFDPASPADLSKNAGMSSYIASTIADASQRSKDSLWLLIPVTVYALSSAGLGAYKTIAAGHASAWDLAPPKVRRPWVVVPGFLLFSIATLGTSRLVAGLRHGGLGIVIMVVAFAWYFGIWLLASQLLPRPAGTERRDLIPGALLVAVGTQALYWFNLLYLSKKVASASEAYGALGIAATMLLWLYLVGRLMVAAPMLNATLHARRIAESHAP